MENAKSFVIDFAIGEISPAVFVKACKDDPTVITWIQSIVPKGKICYKDIKETEPDGYVKYSQEVVPYDFKLVFEQYMQDGGDITGKYLNIHHDVCMLLSEAFPDESFCFSDAIEKKYDFMLTACPEYIGGEEIEAVGIIDAIYDELPQDFSKSKRVAFFKEQLKAVFHIADKKYPRWIQEPEWPMGTHSPMQFIKQQLKENGEIVVYTFKDVDTEEIREVTQFH